MVIKLKVLSNGQEEDTHESKLSWFLPVLISGSAAMYWLIQERRENVVQLGETRDWIRYGLRIGLLLNLVGLTAKWIGYLDYYWDGWEWGGWDFLYLAFHALSESTVTGILMLLGFGWTVTYLKLQDFDLYLPLICMLGFVNLILTLLGKINDNEHDKYHMYDTIPAYIMIFFRAISALVFLIGLVITYVSLKASEALTSRFLVIFGILGLVYFLSLPMLIFSAELVDPGTRSWFVLFLVELVKNTTNLSMTWMVSNSRSLYRRASVASRSFMQTE